MARSSLARKDARAFGNSSGVAKRFWVQWFHRLLSFGGGEGMRSVLIVDRDRSARKALAGEFTRAGFSVHVARDGRDAALFVQTHSAAIALVDVSDGAGVALIWLLKRLDGGLPVLVTAARSADSLERAVREAGAVYYAVKPVDAKRICFVAEYALAALRRDPRPRM
jgi:two-component system chemotaxis response regulator CheY